MHLHTCLKSISFQSNPGENKMNWYKFHLSCIYYKEQSLEYQDGIAAAARAGDNFHSWCSWPPSTPVRYSRMLLSWFKTPKSTIKCKQSNSGLLWTAKIIRVNISKEKVNLEAGWLQHWLERREEQTTNWLKWFHIEISAGCKSWWSAFRNANISLK